MPRTFLAIDLPERVRQRLRVIWPQPAEGLRPVSESQLHLTLHFLGELGDRQLQTLLRAVAQVHFEPFPISIVGVGRFPPRGRASVLWAGLSPSPPLLALQKRLTEALAATGCAVETRPYTPHVTLARLSPRTPRRLVETFLAEHAALVLPEIEVDAFVVYESRKTDGVSEHLPLLRVPAARRDDRHT